METRIHRNTLYHKVAENRHIEKGHVTKVLFEPHHARAGSNYAVIHECTPEMWETGNLFRMPEPEPEEKA